jgi:hypothetical protein
MTIRNNVQNYLGLCLIITYITIFNMINACHMIDSLHQYNPVLNNYSIREVRNVGFSKNWFFWCIFLIGILNEVWVRFG